MASKTGRTVACNAATLGGRRRKAEQFYDAANTVADFADDANEVADAYVTLLVHAGIAAADVLCCAALGEHAQGDSHTEATALLAKVDKERSRDLSTLLSMKTRAGYSDRPIAKPDRVKAERACERLMMAVTDLKTG